MAVDFTLHRLVAEQVEKTPDAISVIFDDGLSKCHQKITYREMWDRTEQVIYLFQVL